MAQLGVEIEQDLVLLDNKIKQLKIEYEQYFLGSRKRVPHLVRGEVNKIIAYYANVPIKNTGYRFKFNNLRARYFTFKRHWDTTCRKIEEGRYERDLFKARLHERERNESQQRREEIAASDTGPSRTEVFQAYRDARKATGQGVAGLTPEKLDALLARQESAIRERYGVEQVRFKVVVEDGKAKLKATPVRS
jgi:hypothetical protein